jgi:hypothetical protein
LKLIGEIN